MRRADFMAAVMGLIALDAVAARYGVAYAPAEGIDSLLPRLFGNS